MGVEGGRDGSGGREGGREGGDGSGGRERWEEGTVGRGMEGWSGGEGGRRE